MNTQQSIQKIRELHPGWGGRLFYRLFPIRKKVIEDNIAIVFGDALAPEERKRLCQAFWDHMLKIVGESIRMGFLSDEAVKKRIRIVGEEHLWEASRGNKGILCIGGHFGNFEFCPVAGILNFPQFRGRFHLLRRNIGNKFIERLFFSRFYKSGLDIVPKRNSLSRVLDSLANNDVVLFVMDQYARPDRDGIAVEFFGRKAGTFKSLALVARSSGSPVIPAVCYREPDGRHVMEFRPPLPWITDPDPDREIYLNTLAYNRVLESFVLEHPDQWWWVHRRWKTK